MAAVVQQCMAAMHEQQWSSSAWAAVHEQQHAMRAACMGSSGEAANGQQCTLACHYLQATWGASCYLNAWAAEASMANGLGGCIPCSLQFMVHVAAFVDPHSSIHHAQHVSSTCCGTTFWGRVVTQFFAIYTFLDVVTAWHFTLLHHMF